MEEILLGLYGVGEKECKRIISLLGSTPAKESAVRARMLKPDIFETLKADTRADLTYKPLRKIPRKLINTVNRAFAKTGWSYHIAGSYRRGKDFSGDIDVVIDKTSATDFETIQKMVRLDFTEPFALGEQYVRTLVFCGGFYLKLDVFFTSPEEYAACLLYTTGSQQLNIIMRTKAKNKGWRLDQHGLWHGKEKFDIRDERGFFEKLEMRYLEPHERNL